MITRGLSERPPKTTDGPHNAITNAKITPNFIFDLLIVRFGVLSFNAYPYTQSAVILKRIIIKAGVFSDLAFGAAKCFM